MSKDHRRLNHVYSTTQMQGVQTIHGIIGSGSSKEEVVLKSNIDYKAGRVLQIAWGHKIGELWRNLEKYVECDSLETEG